jgi:hypothetical protein
MSDDHIEERKRMFKDFLRRGLVVIDDQLPDGSATFHWTQPDHPEVVAFNATGVPLPVLTQH